MGAKFRVWFMVGAAIFALSAAVGVAYAVNTHTVGHIYHGLGDGNNSNQYVHPFSDVTDNHAVNNLHYELWKSFSDFLRSGTCDCGHTHTNWDTAPYAECIFYSRNSTGGSGNHFLNEHTHLHHNWCG